MDHKGRLSHLGQAVSEQRLDALLTTHLSNINYLCGFTGSAGALLVRHHDSILFTDGRYAEQAQVQVKGSKFRIVRKPPLSAVADWLGRAASLRRIGIEPAHITVGEHASLAKTLRKGRKLVSAPPLIERMRQVKDREEVARIRAACHMGVKLFDRLTDVIRPGKSEFEVAGCLEFEARKAGAEQMSFPTIIAGGKRSALPHGRASAAPIPRKGFVVCDFGVILAGYCSDMTRTLHVGRPQATARWTYDAVREAQQAALDVVRPGVAVGEVDLAARNLLKVKKLHRAFTHSTGHGVGLEIHEAPRIAAGQTELLQPGMVITIEPGIYLPNQWGVRIEDTVVVTETGCEILTACSKDLITV